MKCLIKELDSLEILPWGWVLLRRTPNTDPKDGFIEVKCTGAVDLIKQNATLLRVARALKDYYALLDEFKTNPNISLEDIDKSEAVMLEALKEVEHLL